MKDIIWELIFILSYFSQWHLIFLNFSFLMKLIVWLGNPGSQYTQTRHNIGFLFLDYLAEIWKCSEFKDTKFKGLVAEWNHNGEKIFLLKPLTFMNLSGESVVAVCNFYKIDPRKDIVVVYDDVSMEFGKIRFRWEGSAGGHNGIKSIISCIGSEIFLRLKIWVGNNETFDLADWVLSKFSMDEQKILQQDIFLKCLAELSIKLSQ